VFQVEGAGGTIVSKVESGELDVALGFTNPDIDHVVAKYGINKSQYFVLPSPVMFYLHMNTSRPLFRHNVKLRRAISYAIDRTAIAAAIGPGAFAPTDDYLPTGLPGSTDGHLYPLRPDLAKARALAQGNTRSGTAVAYTCLDFGSAGSCLASFQIIRANLKLIRIDVQIQQFPNSIEIDKEGTRGEPFDLAGQRHDVPWVDPSQYIDPLLDGRTIRATGNTNLSYFNSTYYNKLIDGVRRLSGSARNVAYGRLALDVAKNAVPMAAYANRNSKFFVSSRVSCVTAGAHNVNLAGLCLK
jgi:ABC-type transport system substrate-binding protein